MFDHNLVGRFQVGPVYLVDVTKEEQETAEAAIVVATDSKHTIYYHSTNLLGSQIGFPLNEMEDCFEVSLRVQHFLYPVSTIGPDAADRKALGRSQLSPYAVKKPDRPMDS